MEDLMATTLELPTKRSSEEMGSGSGLDWVALKKKRVQKEKVHSILSSCYSIKDFVRRCRSIDPNSIEIEDPLKEWKRHVQRVQERCITQEKHYYRFSKGLTDQAKEIQSSEDYPGDEFSNKGWILRTNPGPYNDYERLYVGNIHFCDDELTGKYGNFYFSLDVDLALLEFYKELQSSITWDLSRSDSQRIVDDAKTKYQHIERFLILAVQETISWKVCEQDKKERVPLFTKLLKEVVRKKRGFKEVLIEIKENDAASFPFYSKIIEHSLRREEKVESMGLKIVLDDVDKYINAATKGEHSDEELIRRYCSLNGPSRYTYAEYLEKKMQIAVKLGIITRTTIGKLPMDRKEATINWMNMDLDLQIASPAATQMVDWLSEDSD